MWHFLITDLAAPASALRAETLPRLPLLEARLARGRRLPARTPTWRHRLLALAGQPAATECDIPVGAHLAAAAGLVGPTDAASWAVATPVRLVAGLDHVQLGAVQPSLPAAWVEAYNAALAGATVGVAEGGQLHASAAACLWSFAEPLLVKTYDPVPLVGHDIGPCLPVGPDAARLQRWMTEAQMWLHGFDAATERTNGLWPWGVGGTVAASALPVLPWRVAGADVWINALPVAAGAPPARITLWQLAEYAGAAGAFAVADAAWLSQLEATLVEHGRATVWLAGAAHELALTDRWRVWRRWRSVTPWWASGATL